MPAQSPTLSPTLSAIVAALRGSSSGMPCSTLPTRSAPTSAAFVKMPPPTRMNIASSAPPNPKPSSTVVASVLKTIRMTVAPSRPSPTVNIPATPAPPRNPPRHAAGAEGDPHGAPKARLASGVGRTDVGAHGQPHAGEPRGRGEPRTEDERQRTAEPQHELGVHGVLRYGQHEEDGDRQDPEEDAERAEL